VTYYTDAELAEPEPEPERGQLALFAGGEPIGVQLSLFPELVAPAPIYPDRSPEEWIRECRDTLADAQARQAAGQLSWDVER
jgi:hypothetical protein